MKTTEENAVSGQPFHVQSGADGRPGDFPTFEHHQSVRQLWQLKWLEPCSRSIYPFGEGAVEDFEPIFAELIGLSDDDPGILSQPDRYARPFHDVAAKLVSEAERCEAQDDSDRAKELFLRAAAVYRIARFPIPRSELGFAAWQKGKQAYARGARYLKPAPSAVEIPFKNHSVAHGDADTPIPTDLWLPVTEKPADGWPLIIFICGLDGFRTDVTSFLQAHLARGFATLCVEIPGTGDCPAAPNDPQSPDRLMSSLLDWIHGNGARSGLDVGRIFVRGVSTGGYYAMRAAHTHAEEFVAVVAQGGAGHRMFDPAWIHAQNRMEYPFALADALAYKFGYRGIDAVDRYAAEAGKFSLLDAGILDRPSSKLLVINGMEDSVFPIEDSVLVATRGRNKELVIKANRPHMGDPDAEAVVLDWLDDALAESR